MALSACLVTGSERAAIATIEIRGPGAGEVIAKNLRLATRRAVVRGEVRYGTWQAHAGSEPAAAPGESVVLVCIDSLGDLKTAGPEIKQVVQHEDFWELHCHGGQIAAQRILHDLQQSGVAVLDQDQWQAACGQDELDRESVTALTHTLTTRAAGYVLDQVRGAMQGFAQRSLAATDENRSGAMAEIRSHAAEILRFAEFGLHLTKPWAVVLAGMPNAGKSSLVNALVGYRRSITLDQPGTTRDLLHADAVLDGWPIQFCDTAGIRQDTADEIERMGIERAQASISSADLVIWVDDAAVGRCPVDPSLRASARRWIHVLNKIDLLNRVPQSAAPGSIETSATTAVGIDSLRRSIISTLIPELPPSGAPVPINERQVDALRQVLAAEGVISLRHALKRLLGS